LRLLDGFTPLLWLRKELFGKLPRPSRVTFVTGAIKLNNERVSNILGLSLRRRNRALLGSVCVLAVAFAFSSSSAKAMNQRKVPEKAAEHASKGPFGDIPKGPVEIIVSIDQQKLHLYSDGQHIADTSVATGVPSLPTPLGIFDVIQKQVFHRSNIYSGAPMPFMERITWSGVALHEGENIGHRASHGCIRMPHDFAVRLYQLTKLGARVVVADAELKPSEIADPHLFVYKVAPPPTPPAPPMAAADPAKQQLANAPNDDGKKADVVPPTEASSPVSAADPVKPAPKSAASDDGAKTGDTAEAPRMEASNGEASNNEASKTETSKTEISKTEAPKLDAPFGEPPVPSAGSTTVTPPQSGTSAKTNDAQPAPAAVQHTEQAAVAAPRPLATMVAERLVSENLRGTDANPTLVVATSNDIVSPPAVTPAAAATPPAEKRTTPISIFVSRKTQKIYVRQNFAPLFDAPVTIDHPEQQLGTHVFTALSYLADGSTFRWDVVSLPGAPPKAKQVEVKDRYGRVVRREQIVEKQSGPLPAPAEALARLEIPQDVIDRISAMMVPGSSLIVSDQGLGEETGEGTDFVVVSR
jgi:L,D-transpeptidase catalytic domain